MTARSYLYVPGDAPGKLARATTRGADALILDLEDSVAPAAKSLAREAVSKWIRESARGGPSVWVRVNSTADRMEEDIAAVVYPGLSGIYVPKAESPDMLAGVATLVAELEADRGVSRVALTPLIETARGVKGAFELAAVPRVSHLAMGEGDLAADLGITASVDEREWLPIRIQLVLASAAAQIHPPSGSAFLDLTNLDALRASTQLLYRLGFRSRSAIHPAQIPVVNEVFTPTAAEVAGARRVIELFEDALARGVGVAVDDSGRLIDEPIARSASQILARAELSSDQTPTGNFDRAR